MNQKSDKGRAREAKGSVQEAIGKLIGDVLVAQQGASESEAGAREIDAAGAGESAKSGSKSTAPRTQVSPKSRSAAPAKPSSVTKDGGHKDGED
ncbi:hypothetical protein [Sphingomonas faeni]|uniref:hypothetical protein n=1 Tax=Sphingomonas faeni TaxID=185950 RepID=UPI0020BE5932|nr:hypothetical protein [Sphingomonas faeni]MCK8455311.1 hypothetical protein [Sphingomonas faeni]